MLYIIYKICHQTQKDSLRFTLEYRLKIHIRLPTQQIDKPTSNSPITLTLNSLVLVEVLSSRIVVNVYYWCTMQH